MQLSIPCECFLKKKSETKLEIHGYSVSTKQSNYTFKHYIFTLPSNSFNIYPKKFMLVYEDKYLNKLRGCPIVAGSDVIAICIQLQDSENIARLVTSDMLPPIMAWTKQLKGETISIKRHHICKPFMGLHNFTKGTIQDAEILKLNGDKYRKEYKF